MKSAQDSERTVKITVILIRKNPSHLSPTLYLLLFPLSFNLNDIRKEAPFQGNTTHSLHS